MSACIELRDDFDGEMLRGLAKGCRDARQVRRLLALAAAYDGMSRADAAKVGGMDRQTLRDWAHRFNEEGPEGLKHRSGAGRPRRAQGGRQGRHQGHHWGRRHDGQERAPPRPRLVSFCPSLREHGAHPPPFRDDTGGPGSASRPSTPFRVG